MLCTSLHCDSLIGDAIMVSNLHIPAALFQVPLKYPDLIGKMLPFNTFQTNWDLILWEYFVKWTTEIGDTIERFWIILAMSTKTVVPLLYSGDNDDVVMLMNNNAVEQMDNINFFDSHRLKRKLVNVYYIVCWLFHQ